MNQSAHQLLSAYDALPDDDRYEVAAALLRRVMADAPETVSDEALVMAAEELFLDLDDQERSDGKS